MQYFFARQRNFVFAEGNSRAFRQAAVTNGGLWAYIQNRHEIAKRDKKRAAGDYAAESTRFWCGPFMAGYVTAVIADVSLRPCTCRAAEQGFASTEAGSGGPSGRLSFFYTLILHSSLGWRGWRRMNVRRSPLAQGAFIHILHPLFDSKAILEAAFSARLHRPF